MDKTSWTPVRIQPILNDTQLQFDFRGTARRIGNHPGVHELVEMLLELDDRINSIESTINTLDERTKKPE